MFGLAIPDENMSARVHFDFVKQAGTDVADSRQVSYYIVHRGVTLHCYACAVPGHPRYWDLELEAGHQRLPSDQ